MSHEFATSSSPASTAHAGHESPEINARRTIYWAAAVAATVLLCCFVSRAIFTALLKSTFERSSTPINGEGLVLPADPRLEGIDMMTAALQANQPAGTTTSLESYGWVNREKRIVHIPISRAMELAVERSWLSTAAQPETGSDGPAKINVNTPKASPVAQ